MIRASFRLILVCLVWLGAAPVAFGQSCSLSATGINFGLISGSPPPQTDSTGSILLNCTGTPGTTARICLSIPAGTATGSTVALRKMQLGATVNTIDFNIFKDSARTIIWGSRATTPIYTQVTVDIPILPSGSGSATAIMYGRIAGSQPPKTSGTYTNTISGGNNNAEARLTTTATPCDSVANSPRTKFGLSATVAVGSGCSIAASALSFGVALGLATQLNATSNLQVACSLNTPYTIAMNAGSTTGNTINLRKMSLLGAGAGLISYQVYRDSARTLLWGDGTSGTVASGTGTGTTQLVPVYGRVFSQTAQAVGDYEDTVTVTLTY